MAEKKPKMLLKICCGDAFLQQSEEQTAHFWQARARYS